MVRHESMSARHESSNDRRRRLWLCVMKTLRAQDVGSEGAQKIVIWCVMKSLIACHKCSDGES